MQANEQLLIGLRSQSSSSYTIQFFVFLAVAIGIARGADMVRVHDVKTIVRVCRMSDAIIRRRQIGN